MDYELLIELDKMDRLSSTLYYLSETRDVDISSSTTKLSHLALCSSLHPVGVTISTEKRIEKNVASLLNNAILKSIKVLFNVVRTLTKRLKETIIVLYRKIISFYTKHLSVSRYEEIKEIEKAVDEKAIAGRVVSRIDHLEWFAVYQLAFDNKITAIDSRALMAFLELGIDISNNITLHKYIKIVEKLIGQLKKDVDYDKVLDVYKESEVELISELAKIEDIYKKHLPSTNKLKMTTDNAYLVFASKDKVYSVVLENSGMHKRLRFVTDTVQTGIISGFEIPDLKTFKRLTVVFEDFRRRVIGGNMEKQFRGLVDVLDGFSSELKKLSNKITMEQHESMSNEYSRLFSVIGTHLNVTTHLLNIMMTQIPRLGLNTNHILERTLAYYNTAAK